ncbi:MAG: nicotinate-nucleotide--dimethylbenzimidazole phosphoribosyltransferase [Alphaproteobacteria bacterium]|jgi:nicotinate-nucleotide--dimethylbenzimidazole phosphoribosyltransferase|nr:nicotinate-nucleotide--dimethylbenzimidazole phosphoribosyltransferase [Rhodospirillaceae bacterium]MDP6406049.1 nicotinate-nucleotide--dimethylbenzimidazole phosphoribosyltransferase [Alphaproteobacteria bacterium]MDP6622871.1 nicotinate-nucleotide--dimethylbenzimidazole phosphoribosyltransferase [Alphaproteobacteria bacterium]|tara:strand:- start:57 stop:1067 length:1011 start_codon:yes stop_codon:yes gene_type:complete
MPFQPFRDMIANQPGADAESAEAARNRNAELTKPPGALGRLEDLAIWAAAWQGRPSPRAESIQALVFAGNHGITAQGVSAFPAEVTVQMVANFEGGGAAINQLCQVAGATLGVHALELERPTADFSQGPAMSEAECADAMALGAAKLDRQADLLCLGEMGIGNTTSAAALSMAAFGGTAAEWVGPGTGLDVAGVRHKAEVVEAALALHRPDMGDGFDILRRLGGREIAAMCGAILAARKHRVPVLLDGFVSCAAAAPLHALDPATLAHCQVAHRSAEPAHIRLVAALGKAPLLDLGMRLGEASGAALAANVIKAAVATHTGMATFAEAAVSEKLED